MRKIVFFMMLVIISFVLTSCSKNQTTEKAATNSTFPTKQAVVSSNAVQNTEKSGDSIIENYSDLNVFWSHFRNLILNSDNNDLKKLTQFPLESRGPLDFHPLINFNDDKFDSVLKLYLSQMSGDNYNETNLDFIKKCEKLDSSNCQGPDDNWARIGNMNFELIDNSWKLTFVYLDEESYNKLGIDINNKSGSDSVNDKEVKDQSILESWVGDYEYSEFAPPDQNMFYSFSIYKDNGSYFANINIDGFQTMQRLQAKVSGNKNSIKLLFDRYLPENLSEPYTEGDVLLSFEKKNSKLFTSWGKIGPLVLSNNKPGLYFECKS